MYYLAKRISSFFSWGLTGTYLMMRTSVCMCLNLISAVLYWFYFGKAMDFWTPVSIAVLIGIVIGFFGGIFYLMKK